MPIEVQCPQCGKKLRAPDAHAGKQAKCPQCQGIIPIPKSGAAGASGIGQGAAASASAIGKNSVPEWRIMTADQEQYGPVTKSELDAWVTEGRVDATCQILKDGWEQWKWAEDVFPQLAKAPAAQTATASPFAAVQPSMQPVQQQAANPFGYAAALTSGPTIAAPTQTANPFSSPQGGGGGGYAADSLGDIRVGASVRRALSETKPWVIFLAILGFIGGGIWMLMLLLGMFAALGSGEPMLIVIMLLLVALDGVYLAAAYYLFMYGSRIGDFLRSGGQRPFDEAIDAQRSFWRIVGIVTAVALVLYLVALLMMFAGVGGAVRLLRGFRR